MAAQTVEISSLIDSRKVSPYQWLIIGLCAAVVFLDGFDAQSIGFVAPKLIDALHLKPSEFGTVISTGLIGLMLGALFLAPLADRIGRRPLILVSTIAFGIFSLATAWAADFHTLLVLRFLTGLGLGGCMPNAIALTSEFVPAKSRSLLVMLMFCGFTVGSMVSGLVAAQLLQAHGWQSVFVVGGLLPLLLAPVIYFAAPESLRFLVASNAEASRIARVVRRLDPLTAIDGETQYIAAEEHAKKMSVGQLFAGGRALRTVLLWIVFFMSLLDVYMLVSWLPTALKTAGAPVTTSILAGVILQFGGLVGPGPQGWLLDRFGPRASMFPSYLLAAVSIACIGVFVTTSIPLTMVVVLLAGIGVIGGQTAANAVAAISYPTEIRSTGVGWALGVGRVGSIVGPFVAGILLSAHVSIRDIFFLSAVPAVIGAAAAFGLGGRTEHSKEDAAFVAH
jgi:AAHS family 4-hydroxybenzoate transporter-like MFS transporter